MDETTPSDIKEQFTTRRARYESYVGDGGDSIETEIERQPGMLTKTQRRYLLGQDELSGNREQKKRDRMRRRIRSSIMDFTLLLNSEFTNDDRSLIFKPQNAAEREVDVFVSAIDLLHFVYAGLKDVGVDFEEALYPAVEEAERRDGWSEVDVAFEVSRRNAINLDKALAKLEAGDPLTDREAGLLLREKSLTPDQIQQLSERSEEPLVGEEYQEIVTRLSSSKGENSVQE